jgi:PAS domain S-box-containing protein
MLEEAIETILPHYSITHSHTGIELLEQIREGPAPDLIFLDLNMPKLKGTDCLIKIRQQQHLQSTPVIIYSTSSDFQDIDLCYKNGCTLYLVKLPSFKELQIQLRKIFLHDLTPKALPQSAKLFRWFMTTSSDQVYKMSADWKRMYLLTGRGMLSCPGPGDRQWLEKNIPSEDLHMVEFSIMKAIANKTLLTLEHRVFKEDGTVGWLLLHALPVLDEQGEVLEWFGTASDITARKKAEEELKEEKHFLEQITDQTPHLIYVFDLDEQCFVYVNRRIEELTGITQEYAYGMGPHLFKKILYPQDLHRRASYYSSLATLKAGEVRQQEFRLKVGESFRWFRSKDRIFKMEGGRVKQVIGLGEEVTYEKTLQERLQEESSRVGLN